MSNFRRLLGATLAAAALAASLQAQISPARLSVPTDPVALEFLARAQDALSRGLRDRALGFLQSVLDGRPDKVVKMHRGEAPISSVHENGDSDRFSGVHEHVMALIRALPDDGLDDYRKLMEPQARRLFEAAVARGDERALRNCARRYALTQSGQRAHLALIDLFIEQSRLGEARGAAQRLRDGSVR